LPPRKSGSENGNLAVLVRDMVAGTPSARPHQRGEVAPRARVTTA
jgi:hypothetical protein